MAHQNNKKTERITIVDDKDDRRKSFASIFSDEGCEVQMVYDIYIRGSSIPVCRDESGNDIDIEKGEGDLPLITFVHARNIDWWKEKAVNPKVYGDIKDTVFYGGKGGYDKDIDHVKADERIWRIITNNSGHLKKDEAKKLIDYFKEKPEDRNTGSRPEILKPRNYDALKILALLCKGYLAAHNYFKSSEVIDDIHLPLIQNSLMRKDLEKETENHKWWEVIKSNDFDSKIEEELNVMFEEEKKELQAYIGELFACLENENILTLNIIEKTYNELASQLNK